MPSRASHLLAWTLLMKSKTLISESLFIDNLEKYRLWFLVCGFSGRILEGLGAGLLQTAGN
jgi:hypothetical protein